jgi:hypothetical protein
MNRTFRSSLVGLLLFSFSSKAGESNRWEVIRDIEKGERPGSVRGCSRRGTRRGCVLRRRMTDCGEKIPAAHSLKRWLGLPQKFFVKLLVSNAVTRPSVRVQRPSQDRGRGAGFIPQEREHRTDASAKFQSLLRSPTPLRTEVRAPSHARGQGRPRPFLERAMRIPGVGISSCPNLL